MLNYTSIRVEKGVRDKLDALGKRRESYNEIIKRLIVFYSEKNGDDEGGSSNLKDPAKKMAPSREPVGP